MTDTDWLAAVAAAPDDPLVRLAYADWLDDCGDPRGELLRLDVELADRLDGAAIARRLTELLPGVSLRWRAAVCRVVQPLAADDFYTLDMCGCCRPEAVAPELFWPSGSFHHTPLRPPVGRTEVTRMCAAVRACERFVLRYGGTDPVVIHLLGNSEDYCDHTIAHDAPLTRFDPAPDPRGVAYVAVASRGTATTRRVRDRVADGLNLMTLAILLGFALLLLVFVVGQLVLAVLRD